MKHAACIALLLAASAASEAATQWSTDAARSRLEFTATQAGAQFDGRFARFTPQIDFDPADLAGSRFKVLVDTGSAETGDKERDSTLQSADFFDVAHWPRAEFVSSGFRSLGNGRFEAAGTLSLRGVQKPVTLTFTFHPAAGGTAELAGDTRIRRLDFGVGQGEWRDTKWVGDEVDIRFRLQLQRPSPTP